MIVLYLLHLLISSLCCYLSKFHVIVTPLALMGIGGVLYEIYHYFH